MRTLVCLLLAFGLIACQRADPAERSAQITARAAPKRPSAAPPTSEAVAAPTAKAACGCSGGGDSCGGSCGGSCGASCGGEAGGAPLWAPLPANSTWTPLTVAGMRCGGCARRIERALANVDGVLGVKADVRMARIEVATKPGVDARALVKPTIDGLGYQVQ
jgi:copper chaperone CopZ